MSNENKFRNSIRKRIEHLTLGSKISGDWTEDKNVDPDSDLLNSSGYSISYHDHFEGYAEKKVLDSRGKEKIERVYVANYRRHDMDDRHWVLLKCIYAILFAASAGLFAACSSLKVSAVTSWYMRGLTAIACLSILLLLYTVIMYAMALRMLDIHEFNSTSKSIRIRSCISAGAMFACAAAQIINVCVFRASADIKSELMYILGIAAASVFSGLIWYLESNKVRYKVIPSTNILGEDSVYL